MEESESHARKAIVNIDELVDEDDTDGRGKVEDNTRRYLEGGHTDRHTDSIVYTVPGVLQISTNSAVPTYLQQSQHTAQLRTERNYDSSDYCPSHFVNFIMQWCAYYY